MFSRDINNVLSQAAALAIGAQPKECWRNTKLALALPWMDGGFLVDGWLVPDDIKIPIEHGWLVLNGQVIDPTLPNTQGAYFEGVRYTRLEGMAFREGHPHVWTTGGFGGFQNENYKAAYLAAFEYSTIGSN